MWMRVGGRHSGWIAWGFLGLLIALAVAASLEVQSAVPIVALAILFAVWVFAAMIVFTPVVTLALLTKMFSSFFNPKSKI